MEVVILTGMSGAGKTVAANYLEDMGYFCVDNAPIKMLKSMMATFLKWHEESGVLINKVAFVVDVRSVSITTTEDLEKAFSYFTEGKIPYRIIYLEASDQEIINRYKLSRRNHPLAKEKGMIQAIKEERALMMKIKKLTTDVIDTTNIEQLELKDMLYQMLSAEKSEAKMSILVQSFGFKYGMPVDCDNVVDVRFIPNPYYNPKLKPFCGLDKEVKDYVLSFPETIEFIDKISEMLLFAIPFYIREGKVRLNIGVGCTGGRHRSVAIAEELDKILKEKYTDVAVFHRDLENDTVSKKKTSKTALKRKDGNN